MGNNEETKVERLKLDRIGRTGTQTRAGLRDSAVEEYAAIVKAGQDMDPIKVFHDAETYHLAAGFHRVEAYRRAGRTDIPAEIRQGGRWEAIQAGIKSNLAHRGERLTRADRAHAVRVVLRERPNLTDAAVAGLCGVTDKTVATHRVKLEQSSEIPMISARVGRDGRTINTTNIRHKPSSNPTRPPEGKPGGEPGGIPDKSEGARVPAVRPGGAEPAKPAAGADSERCACGGIWESDGNRGRYCPECGANHPATPSIVEDPLAAGAKDVAALLDDEDEVLRAAAVANPVHPSRPLEQLFDDLYRALGQTKKIADEISHHKPGANHAILMDLLDRVSKMIDHWRREDL